MATSPGFSTCSYKLLPALHTTVSPATQLGLKTRMCSFVPRTDELGWGPIMCEHLHLATATSSFFPPHTSKDFWYSLVLCRTGLDGNKAQRGRITGLINMWTPMGALSGRANVLTWNLGQFQSCFGWGFLTSLWTRSENLSLCSSMKYSHWENSI